jgi:hypothetical protein
VVDLLQGCVAFAVGFSADGERGEHRPRGHDRD